MPVFSVLEAIRTVHAAHPTEATGEPPHLEETAEDFYQRVGTAFRDEEGGFTIYLHAIPLNGRLLVRPPRPGEQPDPRQRG